MMDILIVVWLCLGLLSGMFSLTEDGYRFPRNVVSALGHVLCGPVSLVLRLYVLWMARRFFAREIWESADAQQRAAIREALQEEPDCD
jgi:hypothetical protein